MRSFYFWAGRSISASSTFDVHRREIRSCEQVGRTYELLCTMQCVQLLKFDNDS
jgi:hypothetical protein